MADVDGWSNFTRVWYVFSLSHKVSSSYPILQHSTEYTARCAVGCLMVCSRRTMVRLRPKCEVWMGWGMRYIILAESERFEKSRAIIPVG